LFFFFHTINGRCNDVRWCHISTHPTKLGIVGYATLLYSLFSAFWLFFFFFFFLVCANCRRSIIGRFFGRYKALY
jgi:apolipoprotein N-acyltransferase